MRTAVLVEADAETLYALWRDVEGIPRWQEQVEHVTATSNTISHWVIKSGEKIIE